MEFGESSDVPPHQPTLVEGDFFPMMDDAEEDEGNQPSSTPIVTGITKRKHREKKLTISWDDKVVEKVVEFYLPNVKTISSQAASPTVRIPQPAVIVKERKNSDGHTYRYFPSQRQSTRILEVRAAAKRGAKVCFSPQPGVCQHAKESLFMLLFSTSPNFVNGRKRTAYFKNGLPICPAAGSGSSDFVLRISS